MTTSKSERHTKINQVTVTLGGVEFTGKFLPLRRCAITQVLLDIPRDQDVTVRRWVNALPERFPRQVYRNGVRTLLTVHRMCLQDGKLLVDLIGEASRHA
jgi:hypothetical protein